MAGPANVNALRKGGLVESPLEMIPSMQLLGNEVMKGERSPLLTRCTWRVAGTSPARAGRIERFKAHRSLRFNIFRLRGLSVRLSCRWIVR